MGSDSTLAERLDEVFGAALRERRVVGAVAVVARDGEIQYRRAHGLADREESVPMRADTLFRLASVTKPIVTLAVLRLVGDEVIRLDDPVTRWLPDFTPSLADGATPDLTIHHLLTHTAGLSYGLLEEPESPFHALGISDGIDVVDFDLRENLRRLAAAPLQFPPGSAWRYSLALDVLGAVVENAAGLTLDRAVEKLVASPLGMRESGFVARDLTRFAVPYANGEPEPFRIAENASVPLPEGIGVAVRFGPSRVVRPEAYPSGGAGMYGTADDVLLLLEAIRAGDGFLAGSLRTLMRTDHVGPQAQTRGPGWGFGYGGAVLSDPDAADSPQGAGTIGWGGVYGHSWFVDVVHGLSVLLLTNTAYEGMTGALTVEVRDAVYAAD